MVDIGSLSWAASSGPNDAHVEIAMCVLLIAAVAIAALAGPASAAKRIYSYDSANRDTEQMTEARPDLRLRKDADVDRVPKHP